MTFTGILQETFGLYFENAEAFLLVNLGIMEKALQAGASRLDELLQLGDSCSQVEDNTRLTSRQNIYMWF